MLAIEKSIKVPTPGAGNQQERVGEFN